MSDNANKKLKLVFAGTPDFSVPCLKALIEHENVCGVMTQPDRASGRGKKIQFSPVKATALEHNVPVLQPSTLKDRAVEPQLQQWQPDLIVVIAYGLIIPQWLLDLPRYGCINVHASILPRWRGAAPIQRAIESGDAETGITIMQMDSGLDTGDMLLKSITPITETETGQSLHDKLAEQGAPLLLEAIQQIKSDSLEASSQDDKLANYAHKLSKQESRLDWQKSATQLERTIRAFTPWPGTFFVHNDVSCKVHRAECLDNKTSENTAPGTVLDFSKHGLDVATAEGVLRFTVLQWPGKKANPIHDFYNANQTLFTAGQVLE